MTVVIKPKNQLIVPQSVRRKARIKTGDQLEFKVSGGVITIVPKLPSARAEYSAAERKRLDAALGVALGEVSAGKLSQRFETAEEMVTSLRTGGAAARRKTR